MIKKNKLMMLILVIALTASMTGCGSKQTNETKTNSAETNAASTSANDVASADDAALSEDEFIDDSFSFGWENETFSYDELIDNLEPGYGYTNVKLMGGEEYVVLVTDPDSIIEKDGKHYTTNCNVFVPDENECYSIDYGIGYSSPETPLALMPNRSIACINDGADICYFSLREMEGVKHVGNLATYIDMEDGTYYIYESADLSGEELEIEGAEGKELFEKELASVTEDMYIDFAIKE